MDEHGRRQPTNCSKLWCGRDVVYADWTGQGSSLPPPSLKGWRGSDKAKIRTDGRPGRARSSNLEASTNSNPGLASSHLCAVLTACGFDYVRTVQDSTLFIQ